MDKLNSKTPRFFTVIIAVLSACLSACAPEAVDPVTVLQNQAVDVKTRTQIQLLNTRLLNGFIEGDETAIRELFVDDVLASIESGPGLGQVFAQMRGVLAETAMAPFHEFDITLAEPREEDLEIRAEGNRGFSLTLAPRGTRMHVSLIEAKAASRDQMVGFVYTRPDPAVETWRLLTVRIGGLRVNNKDAFAWYNEARGLSDQGLLVPAAMRLMVAKGLLRPVPFMRYDDEAAVTELERSVSSTLAQEHQFPLQLSDLPGPPTVFRLEPVFQQQQLLTLVSYVSSEKLDQASIRAEVPKVHQALAALLPGLCHASTRVAYKAFAEFPAAPQNADFINAVASCS